jgi:hypothetical protein
MKLKPFKEIIAMTQELKDKALAPIRARQVQSKAELEMSKLDEKIVSYEAQIQELCAKKEIDFDALIKAMDELALSERRKKQYEKILSELFPA